MRAALSVLVLTFLLPLPSRAQDDPAERRWHNTAELALVQTTGNAEAFTLSLKDTFVWNWESASLTSEVSALRAESTNRVLTNDAGSVVETSQTELTAEQYAATSKYDRSIGERLGWYVDASWERNELSGLESRLGAGTGLRRLFLEDDLRLLRGEAGLGYRSETPVSGPSSEFVFARLFGRFERKISETSSFETEFELLGNLDDTEDLLTNFLAAVTAKISAKLALRLSFTVAYDNQPIVIMVSGDDPEEPDAPFEFDSTDTTLSASLVIDF